MYDDFDRVAGFALPSHSGEHNLPDHYRQQREMAASSYNSAYTSHEQHDEADLVNMGEEHRHSSSRGVVLEHQRRGVSGSYRHHDRGGPAPAGQQHVRSYRSTSSSSSSSTSSSHVDHAHSQYAYRGAPQRGQHHELYSKRAAAAVEPHQASQPPRQPALSARQCKNLLQRLQMLSKLAKMHMVGLPDDNYLQDSKDPYAKIRAQAARIELAKHRLANLKDAATQTEGDYGTGSTSGAQVKTITSLANESTGAATNVNSKQEAGIEKCEIKNYMALVPTSPSSPGSTPLSSSASDAAAAPRSKQDKKASPSRPSACGEKVPAEEVAPKTTTTATLGQDVVQMPTSDVSGVAGDEPRPGGREREKSSDEGDHRGEDSCDQPRKRKVVLCSPPSSKNASSSCTSDAEVTHDLVEHLHVSSSRMDVREKMSDKHMQDVIIASSTFIGSSTANNNYTAAGPPGADQGSPLPFFRDEGTTVVTTDVDDEDGEQTFDVPGVVHEDESVGGAIVEMEMNIINHASARSTVTLVGGTVVADENDDAVDSAAAREREGEMQKVKATLSSPDKAQEAEEEMNMNPELSEFWRQCESTLQKLDVPTIAKNPELRQLLCRHLFEKHGREMSLSYSSSSSAEINAGAASSKPASKSSTPVGALSSSGSSGGVSAGFVSGAGRLSSKECELSSSSTLILSAPPAASVGNISLAGKSRDEVDPTASGFDLELLQAKSNRKRENKFVVGRFDQENKLNPSVDEDFTLSEDEDDEIRDKQADEPRSTDHHDEKEPLERPREAEAAPETELPKAVVTFPIATTTRSQRQREGGLEDGQEFRFAPDLLQMHLSKTSKSSTSSSSSSSASSSAFSPDSEMVVPADVVARQGESGEERRGGTPSNAPDRPVDDFPFAAPGTSSLSKSTNRTLSPQAPGDLITSGCERPDGEDGQEEDHSVARPGQPPPKKKILSVSRRVAGVSIAPSTTAGGSGTTTDRDHSNNYATSQYGHGHGRSSGLPATSSSRRRTLSRNKYNGQPSHVEVGRDPVLFIEAASTTSTSKHPASTTGATPSAISASARGSGSDRRRSARGDRTGRGRLKQAVATVSNQHLLAEASPQSGTTNVGSSWSQQLSSSQSRGSSNHHNFQPSGRRRTQSMGRDDAKDVQKPGEVQIQRSSYEVEVDPANGATANPGNKSSKSSSSVLSNNKTTATRASTASSKQPSASNLASARGSGRRSTVGAGGAAAAGATDQNYGQHGSSSSSSAELFHHGETTKQHPLHHGATKIPPPPTSATNPRASNNKQYSSVPYPTAAHNNPLAGGAARGERDRERNYSNRGDATLYAHDAGEGPSGSPDNRTNHAKERVSVLVNPPPGDREQCGSFLQGSSTPVSEAAPNRNLHSSKSARQLSRGTSPREGTSGTCSASSSSTTNLLSSSSINNYMKAGSSVSSTAVPGGRRTSLGGHDRVGSSGYHAAPGTTAPASERQHSDAFLPRGRRRPSASRSPREKLEHRKPRDKNKMSASSSSGKPGTSTSSSAPSGTTTTMRGQTDGLNKVDFRGKTNTRRDEDEFQSEHGMNTVTTTSPRRNISNFSDHKIVMPIKMVEVQERERVPDVFELVQNSARQTPTPAGGGSGAGNSAALLRADVDLHKEVDVEVVPAEANENSSPRREPAPGLDVEHQAEALSPVEADSVASGYPIAPDDRENRTQYRRGGQQHQQEVLTTPPQPAGNYNSIELKESIILATPERPGPSSSAAGVVGRGQPNGASATGSNTIAAPPPSSSSAVAPSRKAKTAAATPEPPRHGNHFQISTGAFSGTPSGQLNSPGSALMEFYQGGTGTRPTTNASSLLRIQQPKVLPTTRIPRMQLDYNFSGASAAASGNLPFRSMVGVQHLPGSPVTAGGPLMGSSTGGQQHQFAVNKPSYQARSLSPPAPMVGGTTLVFPPAAAGGQNGKSGGNGVGAAAVPSPGTATNVQFEEPAAGGSQQIGSAANNLPSAAAASANASFFPATTTTGVMKFHPLSSQVSPRLFDLQTRAAGGVPLATNSRNRSGGKPALQNFDFQSHGKSQVPSPGGV
ncbi:unnamed protein product [Amoebophrya sp. A120]|nr:unnamed protein product [Amoebophrya sp. A120]|eukprot:GSA120T00019401001.1